MPSPILHLWILCVKQRDFDHFLKLNDTMVKHILCARNRMPTVHHLLSKARQDKLLLFHWEVQGTDFQSSYGLLHEGCTDVLSIESSVSVYNSIGAGRFFIE